MKKNALWLSLILILGSGMAECTEDTWLVAGAFELPQTNVYDYPYYSSVFARLPDVLVTNEPLGGTEMPLGFVPTTWSNLCPQISPCVVFSTTGVMALLRMECEQLLGCIVSSEWPCVTLGSNRIERYWPIVPPGTNRVLFIDHSRRKPGETSGWLRLKLDYHGVQRVPLYVQETAPDTSGQLGMQKWRRMASVQGQIQELPRQEHSLVCAQKYWVSPVEQDAELRFGCDDAVKIWLNGRMLYVYPHSRGYQRERYVTPVKIKAGTNWFLFALVNGAGIANLGAQLYPTAAPLEGDVFLQDIKESVAEDEPVPYWEVAGPFVCEMQETNDEIFCAAMIDQLSKNGERAIARDAMWRRVGFSDECADLDDNFPPRSCMWARYRWVAAEAGMADLRFGSDDGVCVWQDGQLLYKVGEVRSYRRDSDQVRVHLKRGTNEFIFCVLNAAGRGDLGARVYPDEKASAYWRSVQTGTVVRLDYYWMPAAGTNQKPRIRICNYKPACEHIQVKGPSETGIVYEWQNTNRPTGDLHMAARPAFPIEIDMEARPNGVYSVIAYIAGVPHTRKFLYLNGNAPLTDTQRWWIHLIEKEDFFTESAILNAIETYADDADFAATFSGQIVRAYQAAWDGTLQPYGVSVPRSLAGATNRPLLVVLEPQYPDDKEAWSLKFLRNDAVCENMVAVTPFGCGTRVYTGLAEGDVLNVIAEVKRVLNIDENRIYLEGECIGGVGCWQLAARYPDVFAAIAPRGGVSSMFNENLRNVPVWQYHGEKDHPEYAQRAVSLLRNMGGDARITINPGAGAGSYDMNVIKDMRQWLLTKRRVTCPGEVCFSTFGDVANSYWVHNVTPARYGEPARIVARCDEMGVVHVITYNVVGFALDASSARFNNSTNICIVLNGKMTYSVTPGRTNEFVVQAQEKGCLTKSAGLCGGFADVVNYAFVFAYADNFGRYGEMPRANVFKNEMTGMDFFRFDAEFRLMGENALTPEMCASNHVILFATATAPGAFLTRHAAALPFSLTSESIAIGGRTGTQMVCLYPNPMATNKYLLVVMSTNLTPRLLQMARCDVLLDGMSGSFDAAWRKLVWDGEPTENEHEHAAKHAAATPARVAEQALAYRLRSWLRQLPWGWIVPIVWLALMIGWGVARVRCGRK